MVKIALWASCVVLGFASCSLKPTTNVAYSLVDGVGDASREWVQDLLWWWKSVDPSLEYQGLSATEIQNCDLAQFQNLRVFLNPGGNTYNQLTSLKQSGRDNILKFIQRTSPSAYVGFCAGGYLAAKEYYWESAKEDEAYFNKYGVAPPLGSFPYAVEGSLTDIADDQFGDVEPAGVQYRVVNVSNGHKMLYYGGSTFGWNQAPDVQDPNLEVLAYFSDFYGYLSYNLPAVWRYKNLLLTSVHPEADNCTKYDCPPAGTIPTDNILQNRAWLANYINTVAGTNFVIPEVPLQPVFDTTAPHASYPVMGCYGGGTPGQAPILFCDDFDVDAGVVPSGLWNWQRGQTAYNSPAPWNTSYTSKFGLPSSGNGYAVASQDASNNDWASIVTFPVSTPSGAVLSFERRGQMSRGGLFTVQYTTNAGASWTNLRLAALSSNWKKEQYNLPAANSLQVRFNCGGSGLCALDSVSIVSPSSRMV